MSDRTSWAVFATRPERFSWLRLRRHIAQLEGVELVDLVCDPMTEAAMIFTYAGERFAVELSDGAFRFSVESAEAPAEMLGALLAAIDAFL